MAMFWLSFGSYLIDYVYTIPFEQKGCIFLVKKIPTNIYFFSKITHVIFFRRNYSGNFRILILIFFQLIKIIDIYIFFLI